MKDFRQLKVWDKAHALTLQVYRVTAQFPREELFGITSQVRRCSASVAANIAEGCGRTGNGDFHRFLSIAAGSAVELEYFLLLAHDLTLMKPQAYEGVQKDVVELQRMLASLARKVDGARNLGYKQPLAAD